ncbi:MAG: serine/threonine protein kinase, partial [Eubacterium sp.]
MGEIIGKTICGYKVEDLIGTGRVSKVYSVYKETDNGREERALKIIRLADKDDYLRIVNHFDGSKLRANEYLNNIMDELEEDINTYSEVANKNNIPLVRYYSHDLYKNSEENRYEMYVIMEIVSPVSVWLKQHDISLEEALRLARDISDALSICHSNNIAHKDVNLKNIFITKDGQFKLGDFSVSSYMKDIEGFTSSGEIPHFTAPEVYAGNSKYSASADVYSLGSMLYYLFNENRFPFYPEYPEEYSINDENVAFAKTMSGQIPPLPHLAPENIGEVIVKAIAPKEQRYETVAEFRDDLEAAIAKLPLRVLNGINTGDVYVSEDESADSLDDGEATNTFEESNEVKSDSDTEGFEKIRKISLVLCGAVMIAALILVVAIKGCSNSTVEQETSSETEESAGESNNDETELSSEDITHETTTTAETTVETTSETTTKETTTKETTTKETTTKETTT